jgi:hypothetical protein
MMGRNELRVTVLALAGATMLVAPSAAPAALRRAGARAMDSIPMIG